MRIMMDGVVGNQQKIYKVPQLTDKALETLLYAHVRTKTEITRLYEKGVRNVLDLAEARRIGPRTKDAMDHTLTINLNVALAYVLGQDLEEKKQARAKTWHNEYISDSSDISYIFEPKPESPNSLKNFTNEVT